MGAKGGDYRPHPYLCAKSHPPLWQYFSRLKRQTSPSPHPKKHDYRTPGVWPNHAVCDDPEGTEGVR